MARLMLTDELWSKLKMSMLQHGIYDKPNLRIMVEGMFYRMRVGCPWRDLPAAFGCWNSIFQKFNRWSSRNLLNKIFKSLVQDPDLEWEFIDGSIVRAHQHSTGDIGKDNQAMGKSRGGNTKKIHIRTKSSIPMIPRKSNSTIGSTDMDWCLYKYRHFLENVFARLKHFRPIATRYDKLKRNYASMLSMACFYMWLPM